MSLWRGRLSWLEGSATWLEGSAIWLEGSAIWLKGSATWLEGSAMWLKDAAVRCARGVEWNLRKLVGMGLTSGGISNGDIERQPEIDDRQ